MSQVRYILVFAIAITSGCERAAEYEQARQWEIDLELLASIDFENPTPEDVPRLILLFDNHPPHITSRARRALGEVGEPAIPELVEKLRTDEKHRVRVNAKMTFGHMGATAIPSLLELLDDPTYYQPYVIIALGQCRPTTEEVVCILIGLLDTPRRHEALEAIRQFRIAPEPVVRAKVPAALEDFIRNEDEPVLRYYARRILQDIEYAIRCDESPIE